MTTRLLNILLLMSPPLAPCVGDLVIWRLGKIQNHGDRISTEKDLNLYYLCRRRLLSREGVAALSVIMALTRQHAVHHGALQCC